MMWSSKRLNWSEPHETKKNKCPTFSGCYPLLKEGTFMGRPHIYMSQINKSDWKNYSEKIITKKNAFHSVIKWEKTIYHTTRFSYLCKYTEFNDQQFSIAWSCMIKVFCYSRYLKEDSVTIVVSAIEPRDNTWMDNSTSTGSPKHRNLN